MNIFHKTFFAFLVLSSAAWLQLAAAENARPFLSVPQCRAAAMGDLDIAKINDDPKNISWLIYCSLSVVVLEPTANQKALAAGIARKKQKLLDLLFERRWDKDFRSEFNETLLMAMVSSYLPEDWRLQKISLLIKHGVNMDARNSQGDTALDLAKFRGERKIVSFLEGV